MIEMTKRGDGAAKEAMHAAKRHDSAMRLTDKGREQARVVGEWLRNNAPQFDAFYCSQYVRTKETAAEMDLPNAAWHADLMIRERDQGVQDGGGDVKLGLDEEEQARAEDGAHAVEEVEHGEEPDGRREREAVAELVEEAAPADVELDGLLD